MLSPKAAKIAVIKVIREIDPFDDKQVGSNNKHDDVKNVYINGIEEIEAEAFVNCFKLL